MWVIHSNFVAKWAPKVACSTLHSHLHLCKLWYCTSIYKIFTNLMPVLVCISLITSEVEYFLKHIYWWFGFPRHWVAHSHFLPVFFMGRSPFSYSFVGIIYPFWVNSLLRSCIIHIFLQWMPYFYTLFMVSLVLQKF